MAEKIIKAHEGLPKELDVAIDELVEAVNKGKYPADCEVSQLMGRINMCESWRLISSGTAKELREYYIDGVLGGKYGQVL